MSDNFDQEALDEFVVESRELLEQAESDLMAIDVEQEEIEDEIINRIFRAVHSVKGVAGFFGLVSINDLSHAMESLLMKVRDKEISPTAEMIDVLLRNNDRLRALVNDVTNSNDVNVGESVAELASFMDGPPPAPPVVQAAEQPVSAPPADSEPKAASTEFVLSEELRKSLKSGGYKLFSLAVDVDVDLDAKDLTLIDLLNNLNALGKVHHCNIDNDTAASISNDALRELDVRVMVSTVLERELAAAGFEVPMERLEEVAIAGDSDTPPPPEEIPPVESEPEKEEPKMIQENQPEPQGSFKSPPQKKQSNEESGSSNQGTETVRVKTSVLNALMEMAGEMVLARNRLVRSLADKLDDSDGVGPILHQMSTTTTDVQEQIMRTRLQPIGSLFGRFRRVLRDLSRKLDKKVTLETRGGDVELDRRIIEGLTDPLTHLLRNSLDHGIESPEDRRASGKVATGKVVISAYHEAGMVNIDIHDDGKGIDVERIVVKALEKGLITEDHVNRMSEHEAMNLIHMPGLSTAQKITDVSGRGVGMDVVRTNIEQLGGTIDLTSKQGQGTSVTLKLPLTLAIVSSLIVEAEDQRFALPQVGLEEAIRLKPGDGKERIENIRGAAVLRHRDRLLPIVKLADILELQSTFIHPETGERLPDRRQSFIDRRAEADEILTEEEAERRAQEERRQSASNVQRILVLRLGRNRFGLMVDRIVDNEEIVVKPLSSFVRSCPCFSGTTILGDGTISMILDPVGIVQHAGLKFEDISAKSASADLQDEDTILRETMPLVLFSNGTEETLALPLAHIARIEKIQLQDIKRVGGDEYLEYRGTSLPLIRLHNHLPIQMPMEESETLNVLIPKLSASPVGVVTEKVIDAIELEANFDKETISGSGIFGSTILENGIVLLVDIHGLVSSAHPEAAGTPQLNYGPEGPLRILLAEDTPIYQSILETYLTAAGAMVTIAKDGAAAWELLNENEYDVVVTDTAMPSLDGQGLLAKIRENASLSSTPVIVLSSGHVLSEKASIQAKTFNAVADKLDAHSLIVSMNGLDLGQEEVSA